MSQTRSGATHHFASALAMTVALAWPLHAAATENSDEWRVGENTFRLEVKVNTNEDFTSVQAFCYTRPASHKYLVIWVPQSAFTDGPEPIDFLKQAIEAELLSNRAECHYSKYSVLYDDDAAEDEKP